MKRAKFKHGWSAELTRHSMVGVYECGMTTVRIDLRTGGGGEFWLKPNTDEIPRIKVGADQNWKTVVGTLVHELMEMQMTLHRCRYDPAPDYARDHGSYLFVFKHELFSELAACVGEAIACALPDLARGWKAFNRHRPKAAKPKRRHNNLVKTTKS